MTPRDRARDMRSNMTPPEVRLWKRLKRLRAQGFHFRRQVFLKGYYLDFACLPYWLVVEVDGEQHAEPRQADHDAVRDTVLRRLGFNVARYPARLCMADPDSVVDEIVAYLRAIRPVRPSAASLGGRQGQR